MGVNALELINAGNAFKLGSARNTSTICCRNNKLFYCLWGCQKVESSEGPMWWWV